MRDRPFVLIPLLVAGAFACTAPEEAPLAHASLGGGRPDLVAARDSVVPAAVVATGVAAPILQATLSTKLMAEVTAVLVQEGARVRMGQVLLRLDTRDLEARARQAEAGVSAAEAQAEEARRYAQRIRALYVDSAAPKAMLDAAETGLARAEAGVSQARGAGAELAAVSRYGAVRAPFDGVVTRRWVDAGAFAAPGAPLVTVEAPSRLRITVTTTPDVAQGLRPGAVVEARIEDQSAIATVEGAVPVPGGGLYTVNAVVGNADGRFPSGGSAALLIPTGARRAILVPQAAVVRQGDLTGVRLWAGERAELRWVRLGAARGDLVEVLSGLAGGESVVLPPVAEGS